MYLGLHLFVSDIFSPGITALNFFFFQWPWEVVMDLPLTCRQHAWYKWDRIFTARDLFFQVTFIFSGRWCLIPTPMSVTLAQHCFCCCLLLQNGFLFSSLHRGWHYLIFLVNEYFIGCLFLNVCTFPLHTVYLKMPLVGISNFWPYQASYFVWS